MSEEGIQQLLDKAKAEHEAGKILACLALCEEILRQEPENAEALRLRGECKEALADRRRKRVEDLVAEARRAAESRDVEACLKACQGGLTLEPDHVDLLALKERAEHGFALDAYVAPPQAPAAEPEAAHPSDLGSEAEALLSDIGEETPPVATPALAGEAPAPPSPTTTAPSAPPKRPSERHIRPIDITAHRPPQKGLPAGALMVGGFVVVAAGLLIAFIPFSREASEKPAAPSASPGAKPGMGAGLPPKIPPGTPGATKATPAATVESKTPAVAPLPAEASSSTAHPVVTEAPAGTPEVSPHADSSANDWAKAHDAEMARMAEEHARQEEREAEKQQRVQAAEQRVEEIRLRLNPFYTGSSVAPDESEANVRLQLESELAEAQEELRRLREEGSE